MRVRVEFSLDVTDVEAFKVLAACSTANEAREFIATEAAEHTVTYLNENGVRASRVGVPAGDAW